MVRTGGTFRIKLADTCGQALVKTNATVVLVEATDRFRFVVSRAQSLSASHSVISIMAISYLR